MIIVEYNNTRHNIPSMWKDITIKQAIEAAQIKLPDDVRDSFDWFKHMEVVHKGFMALTDVDPDQVQPHHLVHYFAKYLYGFILDLHSTQPETYKPKLVDSFEHNGKRYIMPDHLDLGVNVIMQHDQRVKNFIEASNLLARFSEMRSEGIKVLPMMVASVVKESPEEVFDEKRITERAKEFETLTMDIGWEVFFCLSQLIIKFGSCTLQSINMENQTRMERLIKRLNTRLGRLRSQRRELQVRLKMLTG